MIQYTSPRICAICKEPKSLSDYYSRDGGKYLLTWCKDCHKIRSRQQKHIDKTVSGVESEGDVISQLLQNGIPALPGKALSQKWADVIAWGCVLIEVKSSTLNDRQFTFAFTSSQRNGKLRGDLIVLVCRYDNKNTYHVFPSNHPMFYGKNGKMKTGVNFTPQRNSQGKRSVLTDEMMASAENKWQMIEDYRLKIASRLMRVQELPILLNAA